MKQAKRLTLSQKQLLSKKKMNANEWMLITETEDFIEVINKESKEVKKIWK